MKHAGSVRANGLEVHGYAVSLVYVEAVAGESFMILDHETVSGDFGDDRSCGDAGFRLISADDGAVRLIEPEFVAAVDQEICGGDEVGEFFDRLLHRFLSGGQNAEGVDLPRLHDADSVGAMCGDPAEGFLALIG